ncbi:MAG: hypothetical protein ACM3XO_24680 [Bacteroidota bacterium]
MRKKARLAGSLLILPVSACAPQATPTVSRQNVQTPAATVAFTVIAQTMTAVIPLDECGSLADLSSGPIGSYSARAFVDGKKDFKVYGDFQIKEGTWKIVVRNDKIIALGSC